LQPLAWELDLVWLPMDDIEDFRGILGDNVVLEDEA